MLVFVGWTGDDRPESMLIGAASMKAARAEAVRLTGEREPEFSRVVAEESFSAVVSQDKVGEDGEGELFAMVLQPTEPLETLLEALEEESEADGTSTQCSSIATGENKEDIRCERLVGHGGEHAAAGLVW